MEVKCILKQLENIKQSLGNQVSSSTNHILLHHPDCKYRSLCDLPTDCLGAFLDIDITEVRFKKCCFDLFMLKVLKGQAVQLTVIERQKLIRKVISWTDTAKH